MSAEDAVTELYENLLRAWNGRDATAFAGLFRPSGAMVGFDGSQVDGAAVASHLGPIFADHPTASYVWKVREVLQLSDDVVLLRAIAGMVPPGADDVKAELNAVQSLVAVRENGEWRVALFQNTPAQYHGQPELAEQHSAELRELLR
jgi:uncharacterized protein (TIGR02246 family)